MPATLCWCGHGHYSNSPAAYIPLMQERNLNVDAVGLRFLQGEGGRGADNPKDHIAVILYVSLWYALSDFSGGMHSCTPFSLA